MQRVRRHPRDASAEYNLDAWNNLDFYDVSMVDGSNLPMYINRFNGRGKSPISLNGCSKAGCTKAVGCPPVLRVKAGGSVVGCLSACGRFGTDQYCCRGSTRPRLPATRGAGPSITRRCSKGQSRMRIRMLTTTPQAPLPVTAPAITESPSA